MCVWGGLSYKMLGKGIEQEYVEVWLRGGMIVGVNYYNLCQVLELEELERVKGQNRSKVMWCGDFNAQNTLWGGKRLDGKSDRN